MRFGYHPKKKGSKESGTNRIKGAKPSNSDDLDLFDVRSVKREVLANLKDKSLLFARVPKRESFSKLPRSFTNLTAKELSRAHQKLVSWEGYLGGEIALCEMNIDLLKYAIDELIGRHQYLNDGTKAQSHACLTTTNKDFRELERRLMIEKAKLVPLRAMQKDISRRAAAASRDLSRREHEFEHSRLGRS